jgi:hypothetical protein
MKKLLLSLAAIAIGNFWLSAQCSFTGLNPTFSACDAQVTMTGTPAGGVFSGPGVSGNKFKPSLAGVGAHTISYFSGLYTVNQTGTYSPITQSSPNSVVLTDDQLSGVLPIGFSFVFYGNTYTSFHVSSNGFISFDAGAGAGCCTGQSLPNVAQPNNLIALAWEDFNPSSGGNISYSTMGAAPNRILAVEYNNIQHYGGGNPITSQVLLYEGSNFIEIHTTSMTSDGGSHTMGIENAGGTQAVAVTNRNSSSWSVTNDYVRFEPCSSSQTVTVTSDLTAPVINGPTDITVSGDPLTCLAVVSYAAPTATDNCDTDCSEAPLSDVLSNFVSNGAAITGAIASPFNFNLDGTGGASATNISDGGSDMYDTGNLLNTNIASSIPYTNGIITPSSSFGASSQYFTAKVNNMFVMAADLNGISNFSISGNNGADGLGTVSGFTYTTTSNCLGFDVFVKRVYGTSDPSINQIIIVPSGTGATHTYSVDSNNGDHNVSGLTTATRIYYLLVAGSNGYSYTDTEIRNMVDAFLVQTEAVINPTGSVVITQTAGLPSGSSFPVGTNTVSFQAQDGSGNVATHSFDVVVTESVNPIPDVSTLPEITNTCPISVLTAPTATDNCAGTITGTSDASLPISALGTTIVTWTFDDGNGNVVTQTQNVVISSINATVSANGATITANNTNPGVTYQWVDCDNSNQPIPNANGVSFTATNTGNYAVEITEGGCSEISACTLIDFSGLTQVLSEKIEVFPNPASTTLSVITTSEGLLEFYDLSGKLILSEKMNKGDNKLNVSDLANGSYSVRLVTANSVNTIRIVINRL